MTARITAPRPALTAVLVRLGVLLAGLAAILAQPQLHTVPTAVMLIGVVLAAAFPARIGATVAIAGFVLAWTTAYGWHVTPSAPRTVFAAAALYALHATSSLAGFLPLDARVDVGVLRRYALRCVPVVIGAAVIIGVNYAIPRFAGSALVELAGLVGVLAVLGIPGWLLLRSRSTSEPENRTNR
jgi:hypothetical protein